VDRFILYRCTKIIDLARLAPLFVRLASTVSRTTGTLPIFAARRSTSETSYASSETWLLFYYSASQNAFQQVRMPLCYSASQNAFIALSLGLLFCARSLAVGVDLRSIKSLERNYYVCNTASITLELFTWVIYSSQHF